MTADDVTAAVSALDTTKDGDITHLKQVYKQNDLMYEVLYKDHEADVSTTADYLKSLDTLYVTTTESTKYDNNVFLTTGTYNYYLQSDLTTPVDSSSDETLIYLDTNGNYVNVSYYGEGDENNSAYSMSNEYALWSGYDTWADFFAGEGYGAAEDVQYYYAEYSTAEDGVATITGKKKSDGSFSFTVTIETEGVLTDFVSFSGDPTYNPAAKEVFTFSAAFDKDGYSTLEEMDDVYYVYGSMIGGETWKNGVEFYSTSLVNSEYTTESQGNYTGSYHTDIEIEAW